MGIDPSQRGLHRGHDGSLPIARIGPKPKVIEENTPDTLRRRIEKWVWTTITELIKDFSEVDEEEAPAEDPEGDPLTVKK